MGNKSSTIVADTTSSITEDTISNMISKPACPTPERPNRSRTLDYDIEEDDVQKYYPPNNYMIQNNYVIDGSEVIKQQNRELRRLSNR